MVVFTERSEVGAALRCALSSTEPGVCIGATLNKYNSELQAPLTGDSASNELRAQSLAYFAQNQTLKNYIQTKSIIRKNLSNF